MEQGSHLTWGETAQKRHGAGLRAPLDRLCLVACIPLPNDLSWVTRGAVRVTLSVIATLGLHPGGSGRCHPSAFQLPPRDVPALSSLRITAEAGAAKPSQSQQEPENNATSKCKHVRLLSSTTWRRCWIQQVPGPMAPSVSEQARAHLQGRQSRDPVRTVSTDTRFVHPVSGLARNQSSQRGTG